MDYRKRYFQMEIGATSPIRTCPDDIPVIYYFNGLHYTCPNPYNKDLCQSIEKTYDSGFFISRSQRYVKKIDFDNLENWSP
jgi:hypothetical protein